MPVITFAICYLLFVIAAKRPVLDRRLTLALQSPAQPDDGGSEAALRGFPPFPITAFPAITALPAFVCNFLPQRGVLPMKPTIFKGVNMQTKIIDFPPRTATASRLALRTAVLHTADRADWLLAVWLGVWAVYATVECIGQLGFLRVY